MSIKEYFSSLFKGTASLLKGLQVTGKELDTLAFLAQSHQACLGSRMTGGGFGGCTISIVKKDGVDFAAIDVILNRFSKEEILSQLDGLKERACLKVMIHEQYFYPDYKSYQPDFEKKLHATFSFLAELGYESKFFEELL